MLPVPSHLHQEEKPHSQTDQTKDTDAKVFPHNILLHVYFLAQRKQILFRLFHTIPECCPPVASNYISCSLPLPILSPRQHISINARAVMCPDVNDPGVLQDRNANILQFHTY